MQQLNRKASFRRPVLACVLAGAFGLLPASLCLAVGAPPLPPPKPAAVLPPDPNAAPPEQVQVQVQAPTAAVAMGVVQKASFWGDTGERKPPSREWRDFTEKGSAVDAGAARLHQLRRAVAGARPTPAA